MTSSNMQDRNLFFNMPFVPTGRAMNVADLPTFLASSRKVNVETATTATGSRAAQHEYKVTLQARRADPGVLDLTSQVGDMHVNVTTPWCTQDDQLVVTRREFGPGANREEVTIEMPAHTSQSPKEDKKLSPRDLTIELIHTIGGSKDAVRVSLALKVITGSSGGEVKLRTVPGLRVVELIWSSPSPSLHAAAETESGEEGNAMFSVESAELLLHSRVNDRRFKTKFSLDEDLASLQAGKAKGEQASRCLVVNLDPQFYGETILVGAIDFAAGTTDVAAGAKMRLVSGVPLSLGGRI
jgi:hypothetical protein